MKRAFTGNRNNTGLVEKFVGSSYDIIKAVYDNLTELLTIPEIGDAVAENSTLAANAAAAADTSASEAASSASDAAGSQSVATTAATLADAAKTAAEASEDAAADSAISASGSAATATTKAADAIAWAIVAQRFADYPENSVVVGYPGQYSALHWAAKAQAFAAEASDITGGNAYAAKALNLSDLANKPIALSNLGGQPLDANLTSISNLGTGAGKMLATTGVETRAEYTVTSVGLGLLDKASKASVLTYLDITATADELNYVDGVTGSIQTQLDGKQASDAHLTALAGLAYAANTFSYVNAGGTIVLGSITAAGRALLDDADAAEQRTTLGLGSLAVLNSLSYANLTGTVPGVTSSSVNDGTVSTGTYTPDPLATSPGNFRHLVNNGAFTLAAPTRAGVYTLFLEITNGAAAGAITLTGFTKPTGDAFTTTVGHKFFLYITKGPNGTTVVVQALQ